jgi:hypothetical protein
VIVDDAERLAVSSVGWVEHGSLLLWDTESNETSLVQIDDSDRLVLVDGENDYFALVHHQRDRGYSVSVRHFSSPGDALAQAVVKDFVARLEGDATAWRHVPGVYGGSDWSMDPRAPYTLLRVDAEAPACEVQPMSWFNADSYDMLYQSMLRPVAIPGGSSVLIPVQRSSRLIVYDLETRDVVDRIELADRYGNPAVFFRTPTELWADDYDTLLRLDANWSVRDELRLQEGGGGLGRQWIGDWAFNPDRTLCAVARTFSGDVVALDTTTFTPTARAELGHEPLRVAVLSDGRILARDWKSGSPLTGQLRPINVESA